MTLDEEMAIFDYQNDPFETKSIAGQAKYQALAKILAASMREEVAGSERLLMKR